MPGTLKRNKTKEHNSAEQIRLEPRFFSLSLLVVIGLLAVSLGASWPTNVLSDQSVSGKISQNALIGLMPQGWAFFTKSPQGISLVPYRQEYSGKWERADSLPQANFENLFGLGRNQRAQPTEAVEIAQYLDFRKCDDYLSSCMKTPFKPSVRIANPTRAQQLCGPLRFVEQYPVKWEYRDLVPDEVRVTGLADVTVSCGSQK